jgi:zinc/manganese transport system substrate-binding protein
VPAKPGVVRVVAAENFWGDIAKQVGGRHVEVTSIISDPSGDPHLFESDPRTAGTLATAQLVIDNGLGYDGFIDKALGAVGASKRRLLVVQHVLGVAGGANPHLWYWTARLPTVANAIAKQLSEIDPADRAEFETGAKRFAESLKPLRMTIAEIRARYAGTSIAYTERVPGYLVQAAGLVLGGPASFAQSLEDGNDPSPSDTASFEADLQNHKIKVLIYNAQVVDAATERLKKLAMSSGVPVVGMSETMPGGTTFQAWQLRQDRALLRALGG